MAPDDIRLTDGVVTLRRFRRDDKYRMAELANNEKIAVNLRDAFPNPYTLSDAEQFISMCMGQDPAEAFAIEYNGEYVGNIELHKQSDVYRKSAELGYFLGEPYWNKGITTRAVNLICDYGFREMNIVRIFSGVFEYNLPSQRVLEKCGFVKEAVLKAAACKNGKIYDEVRYAKVIADSCLSNK